MAFSLSKKQHLQTLLTPNIARQINSGFPSTSSIIISRNYLAPSTYPHRYTTSYTQPQQQQFRKFTQTKTNMATNNAAWIKEAKAHPFVVEPAPVWTPEANEVLVKNHAVAINPVDGSLQAAGWWPLDYPTMLGQDVSGVVAAVGSGVTDFKVGDRVVGHALGMATKRKQDGAFQEYTILQTNMTALLPGNISFEKAAVLPLALSTAACALYQETHLKLQLPSVPPQKPTGKTLIVWGGSSAVGSNAIQLAINSGYEVIATASPKNFNYVKKLGASQVFDYSSATIQDELINALKGKTTAGALDCIGGAPQGILQQVVANSEGVKAVASTKRGWPEPPTGVTMYSIFGTTLSGNFVGKAIYNDFLPAALKAVTFVPAPEPRIVGKGLGKIQEAVDLIKKGVSATKLVVTL
ncbi:GroES-like protein [Daldinia caldariorum]|uniref:GroES-like protein n=1 Tax=Daldinia caldariorum TaxID=326644 RepID=UPI002008BDCA|nr:GroES-like protein [Daldinia caldariorum]KAI1465198.1 GroES-like protein [Daldinia caldariorum]